MQMNEKNEVCIIFVEYISIVFSYSVSILCEEIEIGACFLWFAIFINMHNIVGLSNLHTNISLLNHQPHILVQNIPLIKEDYSAVLMSSFCFGRPLLKTSFNISFF